MMLTRRALAITASAALSVIYPLAAIADPNEAAAVDAAVEGLRQAMLTADKAKLQALTSDQLSYGHSSGKLETKAQFIDVVAGKKTLYKAINHEQPAPTAVVGNTAIVRHVFSGESETDGKANPIKIGVLQMWVKQDGAWKLLARQAFKL